jgi:methanethiol S-methyltransferase
MTVAQSIVLAVLWIGWCAIHSLLIDTFVSSWVKARQPRLFRWYRLLYNGLALATLVPLAAYTHGLGGEVVFRWSGWGGALTRILLLATAFLLFRGGAKLYDVRSFLGIDQLRQGNSSVLLSADHGFMPTGVFGITRHPWYLGSLLAIWSVLGRYPQPVLIAAGILSLYLVVGTLLEERKIVREYGHSYRRYQEQVSMLFPWKWLKKLLIG